MYGCESWTIKEAECWRIDAFELWGWRRLLRVPWTARRSNQSVLKEICPEYSLEGLILKLQYFGTSYEQLTYWKKPWCLERLKSGEGDDRGWDGWMGSPTQCTWVWASSSCSWSTVKSGMVQTVGWQRVGEDWVTELTNAPSIGSPQWIRQTLTDIKRETDTNTVILGDFNTPLTPVDWYQNRKLIRKQKP